MIANVNMRSVFLILSLTKIIVSVGIPNDLCAAKYSTCKNIYVWKNEQKDFISLMNVPFTNTRGLNLSALKGKTVNVLADNLQPFIISSNSSNILSGYLGDVWMVVQDALKFKSQITSIDYDTGLAAISQGKGDVLLSAGVVKPGLVGVKYSQPYIYNWYHLYIKRPEPKASSLAYIKTVEPQLWYASMLMFSILTIALWGTVKILNATNKSERLASIPSCLLSVLSGFWCQGFELEVTTYSGRILAFFSFVPGYMLYSAINAVLVAELATIIDELPFSAVNDLMGQHKFSLCLRTNSFVYNNFTQTIGGNRTVLPKWKGVLNGRGCLDINNQSNLAQIICNNGLIILENRVVMATVVTNYQINCDISTLHVKYFTKGNSYLIKDGYEGAKHIETVIQQMKSSGVLSRLEDKWIRKEIVTNGDGTSQIPQASFGHISGVLYVYLVAILISLTLLLTEIIIYKYFQTRNPNSSKGVIRPFIK